LLISALLLTSISAGAAPSHKAPQRKVAARREPAICTSLANDYEGASKSLAMLQADGLIDNSAPRATMRETQSANILEKARITMDLMKNNGCKGPTSAPSGDRYLSNALECKTAVLKQETAMMRDMANGGTASDPTPVPECD